MKKEKSIFQKIVTQVAMLILASTLLGWINLFVSLKNNLKQILSHFIEGFKQLKKNLQKIIQIFQNIKSKIPFINNYNQYQQNQENYTNNSYQNVNNKVNHNNNNNKNQNNITDRVTLYNIDNKCSICLQNIQNKISSSCHHSYCMECLLNYWEMKDKNQLICPICRSSIKMLNKQFLDQDIEDPKKKNKVAIWNNQLCHYNYLYADQKRSLRQIWRDIPYLLKQSSQLFQSTEGMMYMISTACSSHYFIFLSLYIISPIDLIPECIFGFLGLIDDLFVLAALLVLISNFYKQYITSRNSSSDSQNSPNNSTIDNISNEDNQEERYVQQQQEQQQQVSNPIY